MCKLVVTCLLCFLTSACWAIEYYVPGEALYVWAENGLNLRIQPDPNALIIERIEKGKKVLTLDYQDPNLPYSVEVIRGAPEMKDQPALPNLELKGYWAKVQYGNNSGYVFDAYLSHLPTITGRQYEKQEDEDFHVAALKKHHRVIQQIGENRYINDLKFVRYIFDGGYIIDISGGSGNWSKEMLFPDNLSLTEGYLIYVHTMKMQSDRLLKRGEDYLIFEIETGTLTIKKAGLFLVIYEEHRC